MDWRKRRTTNTRRVHYWYLINREIFSWYCLEDTMMLNMKRRLSFKKRRTGSSSTVASASDSEDRVIMLCEDIPSESSLDSGRGSQSPGARSSGDSQTGYEPDWSSERDLRQINGGFGMDDRTAVPDSHYHAGESYSMPYTIHATQMTGCLLHFWLSIDLWCRN